MTDISRIVDSTIIPHEAFSQGHKQLEQLYVYAANKGEAEGLAILGESGTGKTTLLKEFIADHKLVRKADGMEGEVLFASVPSNPTIKGLAGVLLQSLGATDWDRGTEIQKTQRLTTLVDEVGTLIVVIDEFQHFIEKRSGKIMYRTADWLKKFIDDTGRTLVVSGLPSCRAVIDQNEQLARRFLAPIELTRFHWGDSSERAQFQGILLAFYEEIKKQCDLPELHSPEMSFRFYCATGGLIGYLAKLLRKTLRNTSSDRKLSITLNDFHTAYLQAIWRPVRMKGLPHPFEAGFAPTEHVDLVNRVTQIGMPEEIADLKSSRAHRADEVAQSRS